jgi:hypothetical protein
MLMKRIGEKWIEAEVNVPMGSPARETGKRL